MDDIVDCQLQAHPSKTSSCHLLRHFQRPHDPECSHQSSQPVVFVEVHVDEEILASVDCGDSIKKGIPAVRVSHDIILMDINVFDVVVLIDL